MRFRPHAQDIVAGVMFIAFAALMLYLNFESHPIGTARRMGSGYMPMLAFGLLAALGLAILISGLFTGPEPVGRFAWRDMALILGATTVFGLAVERLGFVVSISLCILIASLAEKTWKPLRVLGLTLFLLALCWAVFIWYLDIRIRLFPWSF
ncbi:tripartite tricarboxylate transporter TctB family protein [Elioraea sp.]|uniref:tripartite tricarboxylate transporter TctB family protein n=1 Tax=Elioraea sp. TaxID=2185103 RepID=UPI0021DE6B8B|nr:tripartite tricarboxylate transporter TctB family protein [Elioraea sp.]GIX11014.1 MAG: hypothetical protein KatS3mg116_2724 [Elioraea sp.]